MIGLTFSLYIGIAIWSKAGSTKEFYVAGGGVSPIANGMATAADWMSAASFISMAGLISFMGYDGSVYLMGWTGGYVLLALLLAPYLRKFGKFTVPDFIGDRYYSNTARAVAVLCALIISFTYVAGQMRGVGLVFSRYLEVDINTGNNWYGDCFILCSFGWYERNYLYTSCSILCFNFCFYGTSHIHFYSNDRKSNSPTWLWVSRSGWNLSFR
jgi:probable sodium:solute symporter